MTNKSIQLYLTVSEPHLEDEGLEALTTRLIYDLRTLGLESINRQPTAQPPKGAKSPEAVTLGAMGLALATAVIPKLIEFLQGWCLRGEKRTVKIKTSHGLVVKFPTEKNLTEEELIDLAKKLEGIQ